jgi:hypothetical protein
MSSEKINTTKKIPEGMVTLHNDLLRVAKKYQEDTGKQAASLTRRFYREHKQSGVLPYDKYYPTWDQALEGAGLEYIIEESTSKKEGPVFDREYFRHNIFNEELKTYVGKYFVTSVIAGAGVNMPFLKAALNYCKVNDAKLIILPMIGVSGNKAEYPEVLHEYFHLFSSEYSFCSKLVAADFHLRPQQIQPLTGLPRLGRKEYSLIVASPKQDMIVCPNIYGKYPHIIHSTGSLSTTETYKENRAGRFAEQDHVTGGLIVEVQSSDLFHIRQIQYKENCFYDLGVKYTETENTFEGVEAIYAGDFHAGFQDQDAVDCTKEMIRLYKPKYFFTGDVLDCYSISHHHEHNIILQSSRPKHVETLELELHNMIKDIKNILESSPDVKFVRVKGNHDEHLERYLRDCSFARDRHNYKIAIELTHYLLNEEDPIKFWTQKNYPELNDKIIWLSRDDDFRIAGIQLANHGDLGPNGSRGSAAGLEVSYGVSVVGHSHSPKIQRSTWVVGTLSNLRLEYNRGPSSWLHSNCLVYKTGQRQMINIIHGRFKYQEIKKVSKKVTKKVTKKKTKSNDSRRK